MKAKKYRKILLSVLLGIICISIAYSFTNATLIYQNASVAEYINYEAFNTTTNNSYLSYGSNSYHDFGGTQSNALLQVCDDNLTVGDQIDLRYFSESYNLTKSILYYKPLITSLINTSTGVGNETTLCANVDVRFASTLALYPGFLSLYTDDSQLVTRLNETLNGSFEVGVNVRSSPKRYLFSTEAILAQNPNISIDSVADSLLTSLLASNGTVLAEAQLEPAETLTYYGELLGGETIVINGILSLEIKIFNPCEIINESGYYILNNTNTSLIREANNTCVVINNLSNIVFNFGDDYIDGDNLTNGSQAVGKCPVLVNDSNNIAFENFQTQEFYYGLCVYNSNVTLFGDGSTFNSVGALVSNNSRVLFEDFIFENSNAEVDIHNDSYVRFYNVNITTAALNAEFYNTIVRPVIDEPPLPAPEANGTDIDQFVEIGANELIAWAQINFSYPEPLPNGLAIDDVNILKYNGTYNLTNVTTTTIVNGTEINTTTEEYTWINGNWSQLYTLVAPQSKEIIAPNQSSFSVFAPFAYEINVTNPEPEPEPEPDPDPDPDPEPSTGPTGGASSGGSGGGSGGFPQNANDDLSVLLEAIQLNITFEEDIVIEQGQPIPISFVLNNTGDITASDITISANVPLDWETVNVTISELGPNLTVVDAILIAPHEKAVPSTYNIPVDVFIKNGTYKVTTEILTVKVIPASDLRRLRVVEYPPIIQMAPNEELNISFLVNNVGSNDLENVQIQFSENTCLRNVNGANDILRGETKLFRYVFFSNQPGECDIEITFYEDTTLVGFVPLTVQVQTETGSQTKKTSYFLLILLFIWTALTFFVVGRRKNKKIPEETEVKHEL